MKTKKKLKGSVLVVSIMILAIILIAALSISSVSIQEQKASVGSSKSGQAFQSASTGIEVVMNDIVKGSYTKVNQIQESHCKSSGSSKGLIKFDEYTVEFRDVDEKKINCFSEEPIKSVYSIKSVGNASGNSRAIVAPVVITRP